ncbi:MAG: RNA polymerase sigma factor [Lachnospiraceae bacterium]
MNTDEDLIKLWKAGNELAFNAIYDRYKDIALRTAWLLCKNYADSEDIVQETFVLCHMHIDQLKEGMSFKSWMLKILVRNAWKSVKKAKREIPEEEKMDSGWNWGVQGKEPLEQTLEQEESLAIGNAINQLSKKHRMIIVLYYYNDLSVREIAKIIGCMEGTVKSRLYFARKQLREILKKEGYE